MGDNEKREELIENLFLDMRKRIDSNPHHEIFVERIRPVDSVEFSYIYMKYPEICEKNQFLLIMEMREGKKAPKTIVKISRFPRSIEAFREDNMTGFIMDLLITGCYQLSHRISIERLEDKFEGILKRKKKYWEYDVLHVDDERFRFSWKKRKELIPDSFFEKRDKSCG